VENVITFVGQLDFHAPRLTVKDTFDFAFQCKSGGTHADPKLVTSDAARELVKKLNAQDARVTMGLKLLGLDHVADTFVGNSEIRGVSGGQRRRVTLGEMLQSNSTPVLCADEMSTGLDAASTFDIVNTIMQFTRINRSTRVISLLQPSPETVSLFDEVILLGGGKVLFAGPVTAVEDYFASLGYSAPDQIDVADFLQVLSTPEGAELYHPPEGSDKTIPYSLTELAEAFRNSKEFQRIEERQNEPFETEWENTQSTKLTLSPTTVVLKKKYQNSGLRSTFLNIRRNLVIWSRDRRFLIANAAKNVIMGVSVGGVFFQTDSVVSIYGVLFQLNLFIMLGAMTSVPEQVSDRIIFYRHADDNFYGAFSYAIGKGVSLLPQVRVPYVFRGIFTVLSESALTLSCSRW
jgi:ABC-type multidrug transport system ATPase subunit